MLIKVDKTQFYKNTIYPETADNDKKKIELTLKCTSEELANVPSWMALLLSRKREEMKMDHIVTSVLEKQIQFDM